MFIYDKVLFLSVHIVGDKVHNDTEWRIRHEDNLLWTRKKLLRNYKDIYALVLFTHAGFKSTSKYGDFFLPFIELNDQLYHKYCKKIPSKSSIFESYINCSLSFQL